ncbi:MAG: hypothetical protein Q7T20_02350 [Saprospiraceae bacterium]|nr:hypothetical protein [Saprospiraceae bacterium]
MSSPSEQVNLQVEIPFEQVLAFVERLNPEQKQALFDKLRIDTFRQRWERLSSKIKSPNFTEKEILEEVKAIRQARHVANP